MAEIIIDSAEVIAQKIAAAKQAQQNFAAISYVKRCALVAAYADALTNARASLGDIVEKEAGKTRKEALAEVDGAIDILHKTIAQASLPELGGMSRVKMRPSVGLVGLVTSFNFPIAVAHWNIAPALLAGNGVVWKPSEKTPLVALACKQIFDMVAGDNAALLQVLKGGREVGERLVAHEDVALVSATGSVRMGEEIKRVLASKKNSVLPILELGGNNAVVIGEAMNEAHLQWSITALLQSFLGTTGQRCTNTRRLIVHEKWLEKTVSLLEKMLGVIIASGELSEPDNAFGYCRLIDAQALARFEAGKTQAVSEGGVILFGEGNEPALALMPTQTAVMHQEFFAPLLFIVAYAGEIENAITLVNAPDNAGLVNAIYTLSQHEADVFAALNEAGHTLINSPKGTGTPAYGMGFGGNKASGVGEIVNAADPLAPFTRAGKIKRIAQNKEIALQE